MTHQTPLIQQPQLVLLLCLAALCGAVPLNAKKELVQSEAIVTDATNEIEAGFAPLGAAVQKIGEDTLLIGGIATKNRSSKNFEGLVGSVGYTLISASGKQNLTLPSGPSELSFGSLSLYSYRPEERDEVVTSGFIGLLVKAKNTFLGLWKSRKAAAFNNELIHVGGWEENAPSEKVYSMIFDGTITRVDELPPLPFPLLGAGSRVINDILYVVGGLSSLEPTTANTKVYKLDLRQLHAAQFGDESMPQWEVLADLPEAMRSGLIRPQLSMQFDDRVERNALVVSGGWKPVDGGGFIPSQNSAYIFQEAMPGQPLQWTALEPLSEGIQLNSGREFGQSFIIYGSNRSGIQPKRLPDLWAPSSEEPLLLMQDFRTDNWVAVPADNLNPAPEVISSNRKSVDVYSPVSGKLTELTFTTAKKRFPPSAYVIIVLYIGGMLFLGWFYSKKNKEKGLEQYVLAGRGLHWFIAGISIYASGISAYSFAGIPGKSYAANWLRVGEPIVAFFGMLLVGYLLIPMFRRMGLTTMTQYSEKRFGKLIRTIGALNYILLQLAARMAGILLLPAMALTAVTGIDIYHCILFVGIMSTLYTVMGGLNAVVWTDFAQIIVLFGGAFAAVVALVTGIDGGIGTLVEVSSQYSKTKAFDWSFTLESITVWVFILWGLSDTTSRMGQDTMQRVFATDGEKSARRSMITCAVISVPGALLFFSIGTLVFVFYQTNPALIDPTLGAESMFPLFMSQSMHPLVAGLVIAGLFAAAMSTLDTGMHSVSTVVVTDWFEAFNKNASDQTRLRTARIVTVVIGMAGTAAAMYVASFEVRSVWDYFGKTIGIVGGVLAGGFILSIFTTRAHSLGYLAGGLANYVIMFGWTMHNVHWVIYGIVNLAIASILGYVFSLILPKLPSERNKDLTGLTFWTRNQPIAVRKGP